MKVFIDVFKMSEIPAKTRANIIVKLGQLINDQYACNITEPIVYELVTSLGVKHNILKDERFLEQAGVKGDTCP